MDMTRDSGESTQSRRTEIRKQRLLRLGLLSAGVVVLAVVAWTAITLAWNIVTLPDVKEALKGPIEPNHTSKLLARDGSVIMTYGRYYHKPVALDKVSPKLVDAVLATEDRRFYAHGGLDPLGIARAVLRNIGERDVKEGASTISQQLARVLFLSNERSWLRKMKEAVLAMRLERALDKKDILALYLNNAYFGEGAYGVEAASNIYFNKPASKLDTAEAAMLAGLIQAPSSYDPFLHPQAAKNRRNEVLGNLVETGKLKKEEAKSLSARPVRPNPTGRRLSAPDKFPYFSRAVLREVLSEMHMEEKAFWEGGYRVHTTLDPKAQRIAQQQVRRMLSARGRGPRQGGLISLDERNRIIAYVGGRDFNGQQFDHVRLAHRPAGSLFKIFVYATAFKQGMAPSTTYRDSYVRFGNWTPHNYDRDYHGRMTLAKALIRSNNVIAVKVLQDVKPDNVIRLARDMGVDSSMEPNLSLALGAADVTLEEMTGAFSVLRANGLYRKPYMVEKVEASDGNVVYKINQEERTVLDRTTRDTLVSVMREVMAHGTGRAALIGHQAAGKTGTSDEHRDAWFIGFTPNVTTGIWVGNDDNSRMAGVTGGTVPAMIWKGYMSRVLAASDKHEFDLAYALPLEGRDSMLASTPMGEDEPMGPWAAGYSLAEELALRFENRNNRVSVQSLAEPIAMAAQVVEEKEKPRSPAEQKKRFKKLKKAWKKIKQEFKTAE